MLTLVRGGHVLASSGVGVEPADVLIEGARIRAVGPQLTAPADARVVDATGRLVLPGLVNAHTHAHNALLKGLADRWTLEDLLTHGAALNANRTVEEQYLSAALNAVEMLKTGCTAAYDLFMARRRRRPRRESRRWSARTPTWGSAPPWRRRWPTWASSGRCPACSTLLPADLKAAVDAIQVAPTDGLLRLTGDALRRWHGAADGRIRIHISPDHPRPVHGRVPRGLRAARARARGGGPHAPRRDPRCRWSTLSSVGVRPSSAAW